MTDKIIVKELDVRVVLGYDSWERDKPQTVIITVEIHTSIASAGLSDKVTDSIHYGHTKKRIEAFVENHPRLKSIEAMAEGVAKACLEMGPRALGVRVEIRKPRALLHAKSAGVVIYRTREDVFGEWPSIPVIEGETDDQKLIRQARHNKEIENALRPEDHSYHLIKEDLIFVEDLHLNVIIGVNLWERHFRQTVKLHLKIHSPKQPISIGSSSQLVDYVPHKNNFRFLVETVSSFVEASSFRTVEAFSSAVARVAIKQCHVDKITVRVEKPSALMFAACSGVEITRSSADFNLWPASLPSSKVSSLLDANAIDAYIALGTNMGDRLSNLHNALNKLNATDGIVVKETSFLYDTAPMYVTDQPLFLNGACKIQTTLGPIELLDQLKKIEGDMGRDFGSIRFGPRIIDLDILFYGDKKIDTERLTIPHPRLHERRFQLAPLCDINDELFHPQLGKTVATLLRQLTTHSAAPDDVIQVTPLSTNKDRTAQLKTMSKKHRSGTLVMGILNCTPDSFSDGGDHNDVKSAVSFAKQMVESGADILDIGGQSTRPGSQRVSEEDEIARIIPVIKMIREDGISVPISVDTFYSSVAKVALDAGADIINDVSGGTFDLEMLPLAARYQCPIIIMHMRGTPQTMNSHSDYSDFGNDVIRGVRHELSRRVREALDAGVPRWNVILDPGVGFAKAGAQNFELLRRLNEITLYSLPPTSEDENMLLSEEENLATYLHDYPVLVGSSRKRFIGTVTGKENAKDRSWGTAATVTAAIQGGAGIVRVHDVAEMVDVVKVTDSIWCN
ncbi:trifunctional dihydropteroate synthetase [Mycoemilia scoparia]|uniref:Folic acid synthesis protein FOL1 n=1 Tax=Mycoemilia scoparia TaxID=417184 RepID=A0A9W8DW75_9FUNG|nr:trifunctional dihydropteroate synthetase [Mycoemilia scoparia]